MAFDDFVGNESDLHDYKAMVEKWRTLWLTLGDLV